MKNRIFTACFASLGIMSAIVGCSGSSGSNRGPVPVYHAKGKITLDGAPLPGASVFFHPASTVESKNGKRIPVPSCLTDKNGSFVVTTFKPGDGLPKGDYKVTVSCPDVEKPVLDSKGKPVRGEFEELLPPRYQDDQNSGLTVSINMGKNALPEFALTR